MSRRNPRDRGADAAAPALDPNFRIQTRNLSRTEENRFLQEQNADLQGRIAALEQQLAEAQRLSAIPEVRHTPLLNRIGARVPEAPAPEHRDPLDEEPDNSEEGSDSEEQGDEEFADAPESRTPTTEADLQFIPPVPPPPGHTQAAWNQIYRLLLLSQMAGAAVNEPRSEAERGAIKDPTRFDGTQPHKCRDFLQDCEMAFLQRPWTYASGQSRVNFAVQYLDGGAKNWVANFFSRPENERPPFLADWPLFRIQLLMHYGEPDPAKSAATRLRSLKMQENHHVQKYTVEFERDEATTGWNETALMSQYYSGLADRIKDTLVNTIRVGTLVGFKEQCRQIDERYWERHEEKNPRLKDKSAAPASKSDSSGKKSGNQPSSSNQSGSRNSNSRRNRSKPSNTSTRPTGSSSNRSSNAPSTSNRPKHIGEDGKLTEAERERRI